MPMPWNAETTSLTVASAADVANVVIGGRDVVRGGTHLLVQDVPAELSGAIRAVLG